jgi:hypothetical protein
MLSLATHTYNMLNPMGENEEPDFALYPDPQNTFAQPYPFHVPNFGIEGQSPYQYQNQRPQDAYPSSTGFTSATMYATEAPQYALESPEIRGAPSNYSTASGPSPSSSAMGSPHSLSGHIVPGPEWTNPQGLGFNTSIVGYDGYSQGNEYTFTPSGMEDFDLNFNTAKPHGFVGECQNISPSASRQHGSISSIPESLSSVSTCVPSPTGLESCFNGAGKRNSLASGQAASPTTPIGGILNRGMDDTFKTPVSPYSKSPVSSRRPSQSFNLSRSRDPRSSPVSQSFAAEPNHSFRQSHFFSQSSGSFVPPLESSCWFPPSS